MNHGRIANFRRPLIIAIIVASLVLILAWSLREVETHQPARDPAANSKTATNDSNDSSMNAVTQPAFERNPSAPGNHLLTSHEHNPEVLSVLATQLLLDYQSHKLHPDEKRSVQGFLREIARSDEGRALISKLFFSAGDPRIAASMYDLILDADLKDPTLIANLIEQDKTESDVDYKMRLIDLIADLNISQQIPYSSELEAFLADMAVHADTQLSSAAAGQWAWYVNRHNGIRPVLDAYLFNHARQTREEIYEMIELNMVKDAVEKREVVNALNALVYAEYLKLDVEELNKVRSLIARLSSE